MGAGLGGLSAARVLADYFDEVIILDRDELLDDAAPRPGVPQGKHPHRLLGGGLKALENLFPGFGHELMRAGAEPISYFGITDPALVDFITPKLVNHPWRTFFEPVKVLPRPSHVRMSYVRCAANTVAEHFDRIMERVTRDPNVRTATIDTIHLCMLTAPEATVKTILDLEEISE